MGGGGSSRLADHTIHARLARASFLGVHEPPDHATIPPPSLCVPCHPIVSLRTIYGWTARWKTPGHHKKLAGGQRQETASDGVLIRFPKTCHCTVAVSIWAQVPRDIFFQDCSISACQGIGAGGHCRHRNCACHLSRMRESTGSFYRICLAALRSIHVAG